MDFTIVTLVAIFGLGLFAFIRVVGRSSREAARRARDDLAKRLTELGGKPDPVAEGDEPTRSVRGTLGGDRVEIAHVTRGAGSYSEAWTEISVPVGSRPWLLDLRPQTSSEEGHLAEGLARDTVFDDRAFDRAFVVEGAPESVLKEGLTAELRARLVAVDGCDARTRDGMFVLACKRWLEKADEVGPLVTLALNIKLALDTAAAHVDADVFRELAEQGGYRGVPPATADLDRQAGARDEIAEVERLRQHRAQVEGKRALTIVAAVFASIFLLIVIAIALNK